MEDMSLKASRGSVGVQIGGDINVGVQASEIAKIIQQLYELNFPKLVEEASTKVLENVKKFIIEFLSCVDNDKEQVQEKLKDPNNQYLLNASIQQAARFGEKANLELLSKALKNALLVDDVNEFSSISELALRLIPQLKKEEMLAILVSFLVHTFGFRFIDLVLIEGAIRLCLNNYSEMGRVSQTQLYHMVSLGVYSFNAFAGDRCIDLLSRRYSNTPNFREQVRSGHYPSIEFLINYYDGNGLVHFHPLPVANMIGFLLLKENLPALDIKLLFSE